jgi:hypothetical protein
MTAELERELESIKVQVEHLANISAPLRTFIEQNLVPSPRYALRPARPEDEKQRVEVFEARLPGNRSKHLNLPLIRASKSLRLLMTLIGLTYLFVVRIRTRKIKSFA